MFDKSESNGVVKGRILDRMSRKTAEGRQIWDFFVRVWHTKGYHEKLNIDHDRFTIGSMIEFRKRGR